MRSFAEIYNERWVEEKFINISRFEHTIKLLPQINNLTKIADIASGRGYFADFLIKKTTINKENLFCFDISPFAIDTLNKSGFKANILDIERSPLKEPVDLIFFMESIEHVMEPNRVFENLYKSLKPGGSLIISTPNYAKINLRVKMFFGIIPEKYTTGNHHISLFSVWFLKKELEKYGFVIKQERNLFQLESLGRIFKRWLKPYIPYLQKKFPLPDYNYIVAKFIPNLMADLVLLRVIKPNNKND